MQGPAEFGALLYASNTKKLAEFYCQTFGFTLLHATTERHILHKDGWQLIIHQFPDFVTRGDQRAARKNTLKLFFTTDNIDACKTSIARHGGQLLHGTWHGPGFTLGNALDPEGNPFQLRWKA